MDLKIQNPSDFQTLKHTMEHYQDPTETVQTMEPVQSPDDTIRSNILQVDFSWRKFRTLVSDETKPLYILDTNSFKVPNLVYKSAADESPIGNGTLHAVKINPDFECNGYKGTLIAKKRFQPVYTYTSRLFANDRSPMTMTWTSGSAFKSFDYVCLDDKSMPIAKFTSRIIALKNFGKIEFLDPRTNNDAVREELIITGLTLYYCMIYRANNIFNLVGAIFYRPGKQKDANAEIDPAAEAQAYANADALAQQQHAKEPK